MNLLFDHDIHDNVSLTPTLTPLNDYFVTDSSTQTNFDPIICHTDCYSNIHTLLAGHYVRHRPVYWRIVTAKSDVATTIKSFDVFDHLQKFTIVDDFGRFHVKSNYFYLNKNKNTNYSSKIIKF